MIELTEEEAMSTLSDSDLRQLRYWCAMINSDLQLSRLAGGRGGGGVARRSDFIAWCFSLAGKRVVEASDSQAARAIISEMRRIFK